MNNICHRCQFLFVHGDNTNLSDCAQRILNTLWLMCAWSYRAQKTSRQFASVCGCIRCNTGDGFAGWSLSACVCSPLLCWDALPVSGNTGSVSHVKTSCTYTLCMNKGRYDACLLENTRAEVKRNIINPRNIMNHGWCEANVTANTASPHWNPLIDKQHTRLHANNNSAPNLSLFSDTGTTTEPLNAYYSTAKHI